MWTVDKNPLGITNEVLRYSQIHLFVKYLTIRVLKIGLSVMVTTLKIIKLQK